MKAVRFHEYGDAAVLRYEDAEQPRPAPGEVLVRVSATAFNPVDTWFRAGIIDQVFPVSFPHTLGLDLAGTVVELGAGVQAPRVGDAVIGFLPMTGPGAAAEFVVALATVLVPAPPGIPLADAAAIPVAALTAWQALFEHGDLTPGQRVLVNGAGGGVGGFTVQLAKRAGATVVATASPRSAAIVRSLGADQIIDYTAVKVADVMREPADLVVNLVAGSREDTEALLGVTRPGGILVSATSPGGEFPDSGVRVTFFSVRSDPAQLAQIAALVAGSSASTSAPGARSPKPPSSTSRARQALSAVASSSSRKADRHGHDPQHHTRHPRSGRNRPLAPSPACRLSDVTNGSGSARASCGCLCVAQEPWAGLGDGCA